MVEVDPLVNEIEHMRNRLAEALEALEAIRTGAVDALVVHQDGEERIYTLQGAEQPYRVMVEAMNEGAATITGDGVLLWGNTCLAELLQTTLETILGRSLLAFITPESVPAVEALLNQKMIEKSKLEIELQASDGRRVPVLLSMSTIIQNGSGQNRCVVFTDLTEQKRNAKVAAAERMASAIIEQAAEAIVVCDNDGKIVRASRSAYRLAGQNPLFQPFDAIFPLQFGAASQNSRQFSVKDVIGGEVIHGIEASLFCNWAGPDSKTLILLVSATPLEIPGEGVAGCVISMTDLTEHKKTETALHESRELLYSIIDNASAAVYAKDLEGRYILSNRHHAAIFNSMPEEVIGKSDADLPILTARSAEFRANDLKVAGIGGPVEFEESVPHFDGSEHSYLSIKFPLRDLNGKIYGVCGISTDITDRKRMEQALRVSEERFRLALQNTPIVVYTMDKDMRYTWIHNPRNSWTTESVIGKTDFELLDYESAVLLTEIKQAAVQSKQIVRKEVAYYINGQPVVYDLTIEPILDETGEVIEITAAAMDITELRQLEKQRLENMAQLEVHRRLMQQREMERMQIARDLHDGPLQNLLVAGMGISEAIQTDDREKRLARLRNVSETLHAQIHEIRQFCQELRPPALAPFGLENVLRSYMHQFRERHPDILIDVSLMKDGLILSEEVRIALYRIFQEIMTNIIRHAKASEISVAFNIKAAEAVLSVRDNGVGFTIPSNWVEQARSGHLGLIGIRERVELIGGKVVIHSSPGNGSSFTVIVPIDGGPA